MRGGGLRHEPGVDAVDAGLVHGGQQLLALFHEVGLAHHHGGVARAELGRQLLGQGGFVVGAAHVFGKGQRQGVRALAMRAGERGDEGGVDAGRQEHAHRHVGHVVRGDAVTHGRANGVERVALGAAGGVGGGMGQDVGDQAEGLGLCGALPAHPQVVPGRQRADAAVQRVGRGHAAPQEEAGVAGGLGRGVDLAAGQQRLDLGGEAQGAVAGAGAGLVGV